ncbi:hypothetical protein JOC54_001956 [Alkalihalobacillus xiaoxiensis]|uniref:DUF5689 domain-containing protein n=1 Tax=Shouchella xiaoxiensis TaxID=766895 RepID=A0ABS2ST60_9BACI|nr:hypothetical protein [Shouchella xiaoxiensis]MBM7838697.1 hypothetical protein [Shouchella xiaoxiensis]
MKQARFAVYTLAVCFLVGCGQNERITISEDDMVATDGTITDIEFEGDYQASIDGNTNSVLSETESPSVTSFDVDSSPETNVLISGRTEVYVKHLKDYLRVNQSYLKPNIDVTVYGEVTKENGVDETVATKIVIQAKDISIKGILSSINQERKTLFILGEDGYYETGTQFSYDPATEILTLNDEEVLEPYKEELASGLYVEVVPRGAVEEGVPAQAEAARVIVHEDDELEALTDHAADELDENLEEETIESGIED